MTTTVFGRSGGGVVAVTGVGTAQTTTAVLTGAINVLNSTAGQSAARLPANVGDTIVVRVTGGTTATIFPPVGGSIDGASPNAVYTLASAAKAMFVPHPNGLDFTAIS
jgi:hypothetical protein